MKLLRALALFLAVSACAFAQNAALIPIPQQFFDANGYPLAGGLVFTCLAGTSCGTSPVLFPLPTYTDASGSVANPNPVILDASGSAAIWGTANLYKIVVETPAGAVLRIIDNVSLAGLGSTSAATLAGQTGATLLGYRIAGLPTGSVLRTQSSKNGEVWSIKDFGAVCDGHTDDYASIQAAITASLARANSTGTTGGGLYFPGGGQCMFSAMFNVVKGTSGGLTLYGDGPHATVLQALPGFTGTSAFNINSGGGALIMRDMAIIGVSGGLANVDGIYSTGNGQFFSRLWLGGWGSVSGGTGSGIHIYECGNCFISDSLTEHNVYGYNVDTPIGGVALSNVQTYQNILAGLMVIGQVPSSVIGGTGASVPGVVISTLSMTQDLTGGGGNSAVYVNSNAPVSFDNLTIDALNNGSPPTGVFIDSGADWVSFDDLHVSQAMNYGIFAQAGWITVKGGLIDRLGSYPTIVPPPGSYSPTTQSAAIYASSSVSALIVDGLTIRNVAGFGIISQSSNTQLGSNIISGFGLGNRSGGQQNATTGLTAIALAPAQTYAVANVYSNQISSSAGSALTSFSYNPSATVGAQQVRTGGNSSVGVTTVFSTNQTAVQLRQQDLDLDDITRFAGGRVIVTGTGSRVDIVAPSGTPQIHLADALEGTWHDFGFVYTPGVAAEIYTVLQGVGGGDPIELQGNAGTGNVIVGSTTDDGTKFQFGGLISSQGVAFAALGTVTNGKVVWCTDCTGGITSSVPNTCAGAGAGAWAFRTSGAWKCPF